MTHTKLFTQTLLAGFVLLSAAAAPKANAESVIVNRGPNGAAFIVDSDRIPIDAKTQSQSPARGFPNLVTKGPNGAATLSNKADAKSDKVVSVPNVITRGPNGAAVVSK